MAPGLFLLRLCLALSAVAPAWTNSINNLMCHYNYNSCFSCEWISDRSDVCTIQAHKVNVHNLYFLNYSSKCTLEPSERPGRSNCVLRFNEMMKIVDVLFLNLSCSHMSQSLVTQRKLSDHVKLDAPGKPVINGSRLSWAPPETSYLALLEYEVQWSQQNPWAGGWSKSVMFSYDKHGQAELQTHPIVLGRRYSAHVRVRVPGKEDGEKPSEWSNWGPSLSWESEVGDPEQQHGGTTLWTTGTVLGVFMVLILIMFRTSRTCWVYMMKLIKGEPLPSPAPSVLKMNWKNPPFSSDSFLTFLQPVDIISSPELIPPTPRFPQSPCLEVKPPGPPSSLCSSLSSFSNPMYSHLCPTTPLLPCSADSPYGPHPKPNPDPNLDFQSDMAQALGPELDMLLLSITQQCQGVPVVCEYERVEVVGSQEGRVRLTSVDSGVGSGEEVSQDSLNPLEDQAALEDQTALHTPGSLPLMKETLQRECCI